VGMLASLAATSREPQRLQVYDFPFFMGPTAHALCGQQEDRSSGFVLSMFCMVSTAIE